ncbi:hypothetical protein UPYG_G00069000 [Umbra pygmaea]|uniref:Uncharacterized protein n=1 Tax=Umbra pygmaea TaxID=75934 RepID=A0ABD0XB43_UMBPY
MTAAPATTGVEVSTTNSASSTTTTSGRTTTKEYVTTTTASPTTNAGASRTTTYSPATTTAGPTTTTSSPKKNTAASTTPTMPSTTNASPTTTTASPTTTIASPTTTTASPTKNTAASTTITAASTTPTEPSTTTASPTTATASHVTSLASLTTNKAASTTNKAASTTTTAASTTTTEPSTTTASPTTTSPTTTSASPTTNTAAFKTITAASTTTTEPSKTTDYPKTTTVTPTTTTAASIITTVPSTTTASPTSMTAAPTKRVDATTTTASPTIATSASTTTTEPSITTTYPTTTPAAPTTPTPSSTTNTPANIITTAASTTNPEPSTATAFRTTTTVAPITTIVDRKSTKASPTTTTAASTTTTEPSTTTPTITAAITTRVDTTTTTAFPTTTTASPTTTAFSITTKEALTTPAVSEHITLVSKTTTYVQTEIIKTATTSTPFFPSATAVVSNIAASTTMYSTASLTSTPKLGTVLVDVRLMFHVNSSVPTTVDVLGFVNQQLFNQFINQTTLQNATYIKLGDTSFAIDLDFQITNVTLEETLTTNHTLAFTSQTYNNINDSVKSLLFKIVSAPDGEQFDFPNFTFTVVDDQIRADVVYAYNAADINNPSVFIENILQVSSLVTSTIAPTTTAAATTATSLPSVTPTTRQDTVLVSVRLMFHVNSSVPTTVDVLGFVNQQLFNQFLNQTTLHNATYIKLGDTSFAIDLDFQITNVTLEETLTPNHTLAFTSQTYNNINDSVKSLLFQIVSAPDGEQFDVPNFTFTVVDDQIRADVVYAYNAADINNPSVFIENILQVSSLVTSTIAPTTTAAATTATSLPSVTPTTRQDTMLVSVRLMFHVNSSVPTTVDVLGFVNQQLFNQFLNQTTLQNATYIKLGDTSFAIDLDFQITNVTLEETMTPNHTLAFTSQTYNNINDSVKSLLFQIVSAPDGEQFDVPNFTFTVVDDQIKADVVYAYNAADINNPSVFIENILQVSSLVTSTIAPTTTAASTTATSLPSVTPTTRQDTVLVSVRLMFHVNSSVPTSVDVLGFVNQQLFNQFLNQTTLQHATYIKLGDTSFAIDLDFQITNVPLEETLTPNHTLAFTSQTYNNINDSVKSLLFKIVSAPDGEQFDFPNFTFTVVDDQIRADVVYAYNAADINKPSVFIENILQVSSLVTSTIAPTTTAAATTATSLPSVTPTTRQDTVLVSVRLMFHVNSSVPTTVDVLGFVNQQLFNHFLNQTTLQHATYIKLGDTSFAIDLDFQITNVTLEETLTTNHTLAFTSQTYNNINDTVKSLLFKIVSAPDGEQFDFPNITFTVVEKQVRADIVYAFNAADITNPSVFIENILQVSGLVTSTIAPKTTAAATTATFLASVTTTTRSGTVVVLIRLVFNLNTLVPNEKDVINAVNKQLAIQYRTVTQVTLENATFIKLASTSFAIDLRFQLPNVSLEETLRTNDNATFTSETLSQLQEAIQSLLQNIVSQPGGKTFTFPNASFTVVGNELMANVMYVYNATENSVPSAFLDAILKISGLLTSTVAPTTTTSTTQHPASLLTTIFNTTSGEGFPGWALAIIIPCGIAIILIPLWILLACLLCGCCAAVRRRWHRRRSYNVQYTTRNGLF